LIQQSDGRSYKMAITLGGGGGGGAQINEMGFFVNQGNTFTDSNNAVWLKKGAKSLDVTTYPDAFTKNEAVSSTTDFQSAQVLPATSPMGLSVSSDAAWAMCTYAGYQYSHLNIASDTLYSGDGLTGGWPGLSNYNTSVVGTGYIKCNASSGVLSGISNANNYFAAAIINFGGSSVRIYSASLVGGSGDDAGRPAVDIGGTGWQLEDSTGTNLGAIEGGVLGDVGRSSYLHWDPVGRKLYVMLSYAWLKCFLFVFDFSSQTWGHTNGSDPSSNTNRASQKIDWHTQAGTDAYDITSMSGDATHLYVGYREEINSQAGGDKIRKIPLSGNLSWSSGTTLAGTVNNVVQLTSSTDATVNSLRETPIYYKTVSSNPKFLSVKSSPKNIIEHGINVPIIGEDAPDYRQAQTQYQRIK
jgi:hypothetical protein